jgi:hypothetical protein
MGWVRGRAGGSGRAGANRQRALRVWLPTGIIAAAIAIIAVTTGWPFGHRQPAAGPQARRYLNATACLLTNSRGITPGAPGAPAWRAMQAASLATHVMVSYLPDTGQADASVMLSTLMERHCGVIITTGTPADRVITAAKADRHQKFVLIAASVPGRPAGMPNTIAVSPASAPARINQAIRELASQTRVSGS